MFRYKGLTSLARVSYLCLTGYAMKVCSLLQWGGASAGAGGTVP
jgi:hypothetical protein